LKRKAAKPRSIWRRAIGYAVAAWLALTFGTVAVLRFVDPPTSAFMIGYRVSADARSPRLRHRWVDQRAIAPSAKLAVIAGEDQKFPDHFGFDLKQIQASIDDSRKGAQLRGASTITQQVAKNLFLWKGQSWVRKALEAYFAVVLEIVWSKTRILEVYLNVAEFGRGIYGIEAASEYFFGKPAARLTASESALLAAVLPSPTRFKVDAPSAYVRERQMWILRQMDRLGSGYLRTVH
jgi:monofunctional glycosyltransferase